MKKLLFVGECRSITAQRKGWTWADGRLAAKTLFEALEAMGVDPRSPWVWYTNLWMDTKDQNGKPRIAPDRFSSLANQQSQGFMLVALGQRVSQEMSRRGLNHVALVHPAARGKIRKTSRYRAHVRRVLGKVL